MLRCNGLCPFPVRVVKLTDAEAIEAQVVELSVVGKDFSLLTSGSALLGVEEGKGVSVNAPVGTAVIHYGLVVNLNDLPAQTQPGSHPATGRIPFCLRARFGLLLRGD